MTDEREPYGDALTRPFWEAAERGELVLQRCASCGRWQFYPRPFCIACGGDEVGWEAASGGGTVYSVTTVRIDVLPGLDPPYDVALVELDEGPRLLGRVTGGPRIGDRVRATWLAREGLPPLPAFEATDERSDERETA